MTEKFVPKTMREHLASLLHEKAAIFERHLLGEIPSLFSLPFEAGTASTPKDVFRHYELYRPSAPHVDVSLLIPSPLAHLLH